MIIQKKKINKESQTESTENNKNYGQDKCPKTDKNCLECKISDCPEEQ